MRLKARLLNNAAYSALQTITSAVLMFFLYRYLLKQLGSEQLGIWAIVLASTSVGRLTDMGFSGAVLKFVANSLAIDDTEKAARLIQTAAISIAGALVTLMLVALPGLDLALQWSLPVTALPAAREILPFAIASLLFSMVSGIFQSSIDACHHMSVRNILLIAGNLLYIAATLLLVPSYGLKGVALAQAVQSGMLLVGSWFLLRHYLPALPILPCRWSKGDFKEMVSYATNFQVGLLAGMFFDPVTKFFLAKYGDLSLTAYFDMANQLLQKARAVIVSAQQALVPEIAGTKPEEAHSLTEFYQKTYAVSFVLILPYYISIAICLPLMSRLWIGHIEDSFVLFGTLMCIGWFSSNLSAVAYFFNIGTGELIWNTVDHLLAALINVILGAILGMVYGGIGVVIATMFALLIPNFMLIFVVQKRLRLAPFDIIPPQHRKYVYQVLAGAAVAVLSGYLLDAMAAPTAAIGIPAIVFSGAALLALGIDPFGRNLINGFRQRIKI
jgi:O-antigen/teichoic acid export membrane protein